MAVKTPVSHLISVLIPVGPTSPVPITYVLLVQLTFFRFRFVWYTRNMCDMDSPHRCETPRSPVWICRKNEHTEKLNKTWIYMLFVDRRENDEYVMSKTFQGTPV